MYFPWLGTQGIELKITGIELKITGIEACKVFFFKCEPSKTAHINSNEPKQTKDDKLFLNVNDTATRLIVNILR